MKRKLLSILSALFMVMTMVFGSITAFASNVTILNKDGDENAYSYDIYQIFTGELDQDADGNEVLVNLKWGQTANVLDGSNVGDIVDLDLEAVKNLITLDERNSDASNDEKLEAIMPLVDLGSTAYQVGVVSTSTAVLDPGYYLFKDNTSSNPESYTKYIVYEVLGEDITIIRKSDAPSMEKKVFDINDSTGETGNNVTKDDDGNLLEWIDDSDYDIGDKVPYQIKTTVVANLDEYQNYSLKFQDTMEEGLTFNKDIMVTVKRAGQEYTLSTSDYTVISGEHNFELVINDLKTVVLSDGTNIQAGDEIVVSYSAELNENAKIGAEGNKNNAKMIFSNNPNSGGDGDTNETPWDTVITFTYELIVNKIDEADNSLEGAGFTLEKYIKEINEETGEETGQWKAVGAEKSGGSTFNFVGLDDGNYKLIESTTPPGYNKIEDIYFVIEAEHEPDVENGGKLTTLTITPTDKDGNKNGAILEDGTTVELKNPATFDVIDGTITTDVKNKKGPTLPSTGGIGTTIFYVVGAILVLCAGVLLIARRKMANQQ